MKKGSRTTYEYRITYDRGQEPTYEGDPNGGSYTPRMLRKRYTLAAAKRYVMILGPEPWLAYGKGPDDPACSCNPRPWDESPMECDRCDMTMREWTEKRRVNLPPAQNIRVERRPITRGQWASVELEQASPHACASMIT